MTKIMHWKVTVRFMFSIWWRTWFSLRRCRATSSSCLETRFRLLILDSLLHNILNIAFRQRKLHINIFIFEVAYWFKFWTKWVQGHVMRVSLLPVTTPPGTLGLLHQNVCPVFELLHNRKCLGARPIYEDASLTGLFHQLAFKHVNR